MIFWKFVALIVRKSGYFFYTVDSHFSSVATFHFNETVALPKICQNTGFLYPVFPVF